MHGITPVVPTTMLRQSRCRTYDLCQYQKMLGDRVDCFLPCLGQFSAGRQMGSNSTETWPSDRPRVSVRIVRTAVVGQVPNHDGLADRYSTLSCSKSVVFDTSQFVWCGDNRFLMSVRPRQGALETPLGAHWCAALFSFNAYPAYDRYEPRADVSRFPSVRMQHKDRPSWPE